jgi:hypothetical protein
LTQKSILTSRHRETDLLLVKPLSKTIFDFEIPSPSEVLQSSSEILYGFTHDDTVLNFNNRNGRIINSILRPRSRIGNSEPNWFNLRMVFDIMSDVVFVESDVNTSIKIGEVFFTPFQLMEGIIKSGHVLNYPYSRGKMDEKNNLLRKPKQGMDIPVLTKEDFMQDLEKASEPEKKPSRPARRPKRAASMIAGIEKIIIGLKAMFEIGNLNWRETIKVAVRRSIASEE